MSLYVRKRKRPEINIVPLIDVLTTLIFFFLITMQFKQGHSLGITPPHADTAGPTQAADVVRVQVTKEGEIFINQTRVPEAELPGILSELAKADHERPLLIEIDENSQVKRLALITDEARKVNFQKILLLTR